MKVTERQLAEGITIATGGERELVLIPPPVEVLALGDFNFSTDREVMLPAPTTEGASSGDLADGIALVAGVLTHLNRLDEPRETLVAGHTDASGSDAHNLALSERRADSVQLFCAGDREGWADHAIDNAEVADGQEVLRWIAARFGWPCDPGAVDNADGPATTGARDQFRARYEHEFGGSAGSAGRFERADWAAFFDVYEQDLAARCQVTRDELPRLREPLVFCDPPILGCGEHWPEDAIDRGPICRDDRRVEVLMFAPEDVPDDVGGGDPPGASIYEPGRFTWVPVEPGPGPHVLDGPCFELALAIDDPTVYPNASLRLSGGPYELRVALSDADAEGSMRVFHFHGIATGAVYDLHFEPEGDGGEAIELFAAADLDPYIDGIGDAEADVPAMVFAEIPFEEPDTPDDGEQDHGELTMNGPPTPEDRFGAGWLSEYEQRPHAEFVDA